MGLEPNADYAATIPHQLFMIFQMMFAVITPALIIGAFAERMKFSAFLVFSLLWATIVYDPMAHWVWGVGGWLRDLGALDFAGGTVVHINAGMAALAAALVLGKRKGYPDTSPPHNLPFAILGAALLWFGWFGFNAGSALGSGGLAVSAFVATHLAAAAAAVAWAVLDWITHQAPDRSGHHLGRGGRSGRHHPGLRLRHPARRHGHRRSRRPGLLRRGRGRQGQARLRRLARRLRRARHRRHARRSAAPGLWATTAINPAGADGLFHGGGMLLALAGRRPWSAALAYSFVVSFGSCSSSSTRRSACGCSEHEENIGLDLTQHSESAYTVVG